MSYWEYLAVIEVVRKSLLNTVNSIQLQAALTEFNCKQSLLLVGPAFVGSAPWEGAHVLGCRSGRLCKFCTCCEPTWRIFRVLGSQCRSVELCSFIGLDLRFLTALL